MPRFEYECKCCNVSVTISHLVGEIPEVCPQCNTEDVLERVYSFNIEKARTEKNNPGTLVKSHIKEAKEEVKKEKDKLSKRDFKL